MALWTWCSSSLLWKCRSHTLRIVRTVRAVTVVWLLQLILSLLSLFWLLSLHSNSLSARRNPAVGCAEGLHDPLGHPPSSGTFSRNSEDGKFCKCWRLCPAVPATHWLKAPSRPWRRAGLPAWLTVDFLLLFTLLKMESLWGGIFWVCKGNCRPEINGVQQL